MKRIVQLNGYYVKEETKKRKEKKKPTSKTTKRKIKMFPSHFVVLPNVNNHGPAGPVWDVITRP